MGVGEGREREGERDPMIRTDVRSIDTSKSKKPGSISICANHLYKAYYLAPLVETWFF